MNEWLEYECPECGTYFPVSMKKCPGCGTETIWERDKEETIEEILNEIIEELINDASEPEEAELEDSAVPPEEVVDGESKEPSEKENVSKRKFRWLFQ